MWRSSTSARRRRPLLLLLLLALPVTPMVLAGDAFASRSPPQLPAQLEALARELQERAAHAADEREALRERLASAQQLLGTLFAGEREETELFARETRARMQQLRGELGGEMARMRGDVARCVDAAVRNVSALTRRREAARKENERQLQTVKAARYEQQKQQEEMRRRKRELHQEEARRRAQEEAEEEVETRNATSDVQLTTNRTETADKMLSGTPLRTVLGTGATDATRWLWSIARGMALWAVQALLIVWGVFWRWVVPAVLVLGGVLLVAIAVVKFVQYRRAKRRAKGVLYSGYLKPRSAKHQQQLERRRRRPVGAIQSTTFPVKHRQPSRRSQAALPRDFDARTSTNDSTAGRVTA